MAGRWWHEQSHPGMEMGWVRFVLKGLFSAYDSSYREGKPGQTPLPGFERKTLSWGIWRASYTSPPVGAFWVVLCLPTEPGGSWMASDPLLHPFLSLSSLPPPLLSKLQIWSSNGTPARQSAGAPHQGVARRAPELPAPPLG